MTISDLVLELWKSLGEPSDLDPTDGSDLETVVLTNTGTQRMLKLLDRAQERIVSWRDGTFTNKFVLWTGAFDVQFLQLSGTIETGETGSTASNFIKPPAGSLASVDTERRYAVLGTEVREIVSDDGASFTVNPAFDSTMEAQSVTVWQSGYALANPNQIKSIQKVWNHNEGTEMERAPREERFFTENIEIEQPTQFYEVGKTLYFNVVPEEDLWVRVMFERVPTSLLTLSLTDEPEIPSQFHWGMLLWSKGWGHAILQEDASRVAAQQEFTTYMRTTIGEVEMMQHSLDGYGIRLEEQEYY